MRNQKNRFWEWRSVTDEDGSEARELELCGTIAETSWFDDDVTPEMFREELFSGTGPVTVWINSPGGDCIAASRIYTMLMDYRYDVTVKIDGIAASAASVIAMAGTKVLMSPTAMMMIHNPATVAAGDCEDMQKAIDMLDEVKESIINAYEIKTDLSRARISHMMDSETWMNANRAVELGFADGILEDGKSSAASAPAFAFSRRSAQTALLNKISDRIKKEAKPPEAPEEEQQAENHGRSVDELKKRLETIRNYI